MVTTKQIIKLENSIVNIEKRNSFPYCPQCGSTDVTGDGALIKTNARAMLCKHCGNRDINFPEQVLKQSRGGK